MKLQNDDIKQIASAVRMLSAEAVEKSQTGHPGTPIGAADIIACLFANHLKFNPQNPTWYNRDRFVLSNGHACIMLYSILHLFGYKKFDIESIKNLRRLHSLASGHPEIHHEAGIEVTTGPLGEGVSMAVGLALAERITATKFDNLMNHHTYVLVGDGCLMEGVTYEALSLAGHMQLEKLIVIYDKNNITIDGDLSITMTEDIATRVKSCGFEVQEIDGHDFNQIDMAITKAKTANKPSFIIANTKIAYGAGKKQGTSAAHGAPLGKEALEELKTFLNWQYEAFEVPNTIKETCKQAIAKNIELNKQDEKVLKNSPVGADLIGFMNKNLNNNITIELSKIAQEAIVNKPNTALRAVSSQILEVISKSCPNLVGGSADLSATNNTIHKSSVIINKTNNYNGNYIYYGIREHGMGAIMNGMACHNTGIIPYGGTFLTFSDFLRPAIRLSALMERQVIYVFTHDSLTVGGDGPTHQPIEHMASLRLIPNLEVLRPCDTIEAVECYELALKNTHKPTVLIMGRDNVPTLRDSYDLANNMSSKGAYIIKNVANATINLFASGGEVSLCCEVQKVLEKYNIFANVVSIPSLSRFAEQSNTYKDALMGNRLNVVIATSCVVGYKDVLGSNTLLYGVNSFGISGTAAEVMEHFGFTPEKITNFIKQHIK